MTVAIMRPANAQGVSEPNPWEEAHLAATKKGQFGRPDILFLSEVSFLNAEALGDQLDMFSLQFGERGSPEAGLAILSTWPIRRPKIIIATDAVPGEVRMRPIIGGSIQEMPCWAIHAPPPRTPEARARYVRIARNRKGSVCGDWNFPEQWMHSHSGRAYRGEGALGLLVPERATASSAHPIRIKSDHLAMDIKVSW